MAGARLEMVLSRIVDPAERQRVTDRFVAAGGWRGLFDPYGAEWKTLPRLADKLELIGVIQTATQLSVGDIAARYRAYFRARGREDLANDCKEALRRYATAVSRGEL